MSEQNPVKYGWRTKLYHWFVNLNFKPSPFYPEDITPVYGVVIIDIVRQPNQMYHVYANGFQRYSNWTKSADHTVGSARAFAHMARKKHVSQGVTVDVRWYKK